MNTIRNCVFENLVIRDPNRGLGLFVHQEGSIENVLFNNIIIQTRLHTGHWWGKGEPIHISVLPARYYLFHKPLAFICFPKGQIA